MLEKRDFLGKGWSFPPEFVKSKAFGGEVMMVEGTDDIEQSLAILLRTSLGERVMQPDYGCNMNDFVFDPMNSTLLGFLKDMVYNAILYHEPRIKLEKLDVVAESTDVLEGYLRFFIDYSVRETNSRYNFVWDYYIKEGVGGNT